MCVSTFHDEISLMCLAVEEMKKCQSYPKVGVLISRNGIVLATGFRNEVAGMHAERVALSKLKQDDNIDLKDCKLFTTLEPCLAINEDQIIEPCCNIIIESGIKQVCIGAFDPNGKIYTESVEKLRDSGVEIDYFSDELRSFIELNTFEYGDFNKAKGNGKRRVRVGGNGKGFIVQFAEADSRETKFYWQTIQFLYGTVDLIAANETVTLAENAKDFRSITNPLIYQDSSHYARLREGEIAIIKPKDVKMILLVKLIKIYEKEIFFSGKFGIENKLAFISNHKTNDLR